MANKDQLLEFFDMYTPADLVGTVDPNLGGRLDKIDDVNPFRELLGIIENTGRGVYNIDTAIEKIKSLKTKGLDKVDLSEYLAIFTTKEVVDLGPKSAKDKVATDEQGQEKKVESLQEIVGPLFKMDSDHKAAIVLSRSPFFNPTTRNTKRAEVFLNSMPSTVLAQLVPYMQVEFQFARDPSEQLQAMSQLKLLLGAVPKSELKGANDAMLQGHQTVDPETKRELNFVGMEAFTAPITLTNPRPNEKVGTKGERYVDIIDPFRPFASLEHVIINSKPSGAGFFCYKKANLTLKVHDRSRLHEISDLLRPRVYTGVTIWLTYGWRAPSRGTNNPYFAYVNNNLMMREAYHIVNSSFSFDNVGQVTINLELFTKGVAELRDIKIAEAIGSNFADLKRMQRLIESISYYRQRLRLDPPEGSSKEIRVFQILDAAETGEFPDMQANEVSAKIKTLSDSLNKTKGIDKDAAAALVNAMKELYKPDKSDPRKFDLKKRYEESVEGDVAKLFNEVRTGLDPFLPSSKKGSPEEIAKICDNLNKTPATKTKKALKNVVSFGKLFSTFAMRSILSMPEAFEEVQIFFYNMNEQCGPISSMSVAEFPIDMTMFIDQFNDLAKAKGGAKVTLEDFLQLAINAQFLEKRAYGYGLRQFYKPYEKGKEAELQTGKNNEQAFESKMASYTTKYGPFKQPTIEMYIECTHERVSDEGENDILQLLAYSAKDASPVGIPEKKAKDSRKIMRVHVYDKQTNVYKAASALMRNISNAGFVSVPSTPEALKKTVDLSKVPDFLKAVAIEAEATKDGNIRITSDFVNNQQIKNLVSKLVPTIRYGSNGTTITQANLSSKADPLLSTVQMIRSQTVKNTAQPNGAGNYGLPLRVIPASLQMTTLGNPLATMAQQYFIDFQTGTTLDNLYIVTGLTHTFAPGKFDTQWTFGYSDGYGVYEGAPGIVEQIAKMEASVPKDPSNK